MPTALCGPLLVNAKRILFIWSALWTQLAIVGRVARRVLYRNLRPWMVFVYKLGISFMTKKKEKREVSNVVVGVGE